MKTLQLLMTSLAAVLISCVTSQAVDPLPPELENAPLAKKAEYWQRTSKESGELRTKVAKERYDHAVAYKEALLSQMQDGAAEVQARIQAQQEASQSSSFLESDSSSNPDEPPTWSVFTMIAGLLGGGMAFMHHHMKKAEQIA